jgi:hypothetical protein
VTWRRALAVLLVLTAVLAAAAAVGWTRRTSLAEWYLLGRAAALGLRDVRLHVASLDQHGIAIESIAIGAPAAPDLTIERLDASWSWPSLEAGRFDAVRIAGVLLRGRYDLAGPSLGALDRLFERDEPTKEAPALPAPEIALERARVEVTTPRGPAKGSFGGSLSETKDGIGGKFALDVEGAGLTARGRLTLGGTLAEPRFGLTLDPLRAGTLALKLDTRGTAPRDKPVALGKTALGIAGGTIGIEGMKLDLGARRTSVPLLVDDLDLAALLALAAVDGLAGTGRIEGTLPLVRESGKLRIDDGLLRATGDGTIRYTPSESVRSLATSRPEDLGLAVQAFSDFRYELLEARVSGDLAGALKIGLHVRGNNPSFENGRAVELNLNLETRLLDLVRAGTEAYRVPERIEERVRERVEGSK